MTFVLCLLRSSYHPETSALLLFTVLIKEPKNRMESEAKNNGQKNSFILVNKVHLLSIF